MSHHDFDDRGLPDGYHLNETWEKPPREIARQLADGDDDVVLIDCREPVERDAASLEPSDLIPLGEFPARAPELAEDYEGRQVIVFCHHGQRSLQATALLRQAGHQDVWSLAGGIDLWSQAINPNIPRY
ncbi:MAG: rhodanese-like domain-containing protein [Phycisphaeraceae bacterium]|nr:rhodanese-like domain-containing protein [Phycisphaeraceae bacterium]